MTFADDERGQPVVIGALLIFTILILAFAGYQAFAVPQQNAEVEFNHFQDVQSDFSEFETSLINAVESGDTRSASIDLGPQYPSRMLALNPPPAAGSLGTTESGEVSIIESGSSVSVCRDGGTATSRSLVYRPGYAEFDNANSIVYENRFTGRQFREGNVFGEQRLVQSVSGSPDRINLLLLTGKVSDNGVGVSNLEIQATSRYSTTVTNPTITLPTEFSEDDWNNDILADRSDVTATNNGSNQVDLAFAGGDYRISCAVAGLNSEPAFSPPANGISSVSESRTFNTQWMESDPVTVNPSGTTILQMRTDDSTSGDPITESSVDYSFAEDQSNSGSLSFAEPSNGTTDANGEDTITLDLSNTDSGDVYELYTTAGDDSDNITVQVESRMADRTQYVDGSAQQIGNDGRVEFELENTGGDSVEINGITVDGTGDNQANQVDNDGDREFDGAGGFVNLDGSIRIGDSTVTNLDENALISSGTTESFRLEQFRDNGNSRSLNNDDITITVYFTDGSELTINTENL